MKNIIALAIVGLFAAGPLIVAADQPADKVAALIGALRSGDETARLNAALELGKHGKDAVQPVTALLADKDEGTRYYAVWALALVGPDAKDKAPDVIKLLDDRSEQVRRKAAFALGRIAPDAAVAIPVLIKAFADASDDVRTAAVEAVATLGKDALPALADAIKSDNAGVRRHAIEAIGRVQDPEAVGILVESLKAVRADVRGNATRVLGELQISDRPVVLLLGEVLSKDEDDQARFEAMMALHVLGTSAHPVAAAVVRALADDNPAVRDQAYFALSVLDVNPLAAARDLLKSDDGGVRANVAALLIVMDQDPDGQVQNVLKQALEDRDAGVRYRAAFGLSHVGLAPMGTVDVLLEAVKEKKPKTRLRAVTSFVRLGASANTARSVPALTPVLKDEDPAIRRQAVLAVAGLGADARVVLPALGERLKDEAFEVRREALNMMYVHYRTDAVPYFTAALKDRDATPRWMAANYIGLSGDAGKKAIPALRELIKTETETVVLNYCAGALARMGEDGIPGLVEVLQRNNSGAQQTAMRHLGQLGARAKPAVPVLIEILNKGDADLRWEAVQVLGAIGPGAADAVDALKEAAASPDVRVKQAAQQALRQIEKK